MGDDFGGQIKLDIKLKPETKNKLIFLAVCFGLVFLIYGLTLAGDFVFDDRGIVEHQPILANVNLLDKTLSLPYLTAKEAGAYRPVTLFSYTLNYLLLGALPAGFHLVNLILYALTGYLIYLLVDKLFKKKLMAYSAAIIFLVLPIHSEAAANIIGRAEILALFFSLLMFLALLKGDKSRQRGWKNFWPAGLWLFLAIGSKETAIAALPIAALIIYFNRPAGEKKFWRRETLFRYLPAAGWPVIGAAAYLALRLAVLGRTYFLNAEASLVENPLKFTAAGPRIYTALKILAIYIQKSFWPFGLCSDYSYNQIPVLSGFFNRAALAGFLILSFFMVSFFIFLKRRPILALASAWFVLSFLLVSNLIFPIGTIAGERLIYYPSAGLSFFLAYLFYKLYRYKANKIYRYSAIVLFGALVVFYSVMSFLRAGDWLTEKRLFAAAARCAPNSVLSRSNLGAEYYLAGDLANAKKELLLANSIYDGYPKGVNNLGLVYWKEGNNAKARELFLKALSFKFPYYGAYENLALVSLGEGKIDEARSWLMKLYSGDQLAADNYIGNYLTPASPR